MNYNSIKSNHRKYEGFAHNLIAEVLKKWAQGSHFIAHKLEQRLKSPVEQLDADIAAVMFNKAD